MKNSDSAARKEGPGALSLTLLLGHFQILAVLPNVSLEYWAPKLDNCPI
jgi:hypothetical protein